MGGGAQASVLEPERQPVAGEPVLAFEDEDSAALLLGDSEADDRLDVPDPHGAGEEPRAAGASEGSPEHGPEGIPDGVGLCGDLDGMLVDERQRYAASVRLVSSHACVPTTFPWSWIAR